MSLSAPFLTLAGLPRGKFLTLHLLPNTLWDSSGIFFRLVKWRPQNKPDPAGRPRESIWLLESREPDDTAVSVFAGTELMVCLHSDPKLRILGIKILKSTKTPTGISQSKMLSIWKLQTKH